MAERNERGGWDLTDDDVREVMAASFGPEPDTLTAEQFQEAVRRGEDVKLTVTMDRQQTLTDGLRQHIPFRSQDGKLYGKPGGKVEQWGLITVSDAGRLQYWEEDGRLQYVIYSHRMPIAWCGGNGWEMAEDAHRHSSAVTAHVDKIMPMITQLQQESRDDLG